MASRPLFNNPDLNGHDNPQPIAYILADVAGLVAGLNGGANGGAKWWGWERKRAGPAPQQ